MTSPPLPLPLPLPPPNSPPRRLSYSSYDGPSDGSLLEDREAVLSLNLKDDYLLPNSLDDIGIDNQRREMLVRDSSNPRGDDEKRINEVIGFYKEKYKTKYRSRYKWKYRELLKHMEVKEDRGVGTRDRDLDPFFSSARYGFQEQGERPAGYQTRIRKGIFGFESILFWVIIWATALGMGVLLLSV
ncbi:hypothetical protein TWF106_006081 [Orbilia oligospora]|uniref:Uncharacterized protein n=1 Tax=Orbilia oligospora TaxID=2813651 RepID=A0A7C8QQ27_ORBOL|nr:hypothetical protein TWF679_008856 [Orbilia oligospora]KAF3221482.1 hypothetical protein TWF106_006081 [Orbilia oligospora]